MGAEVTAIIAGIGALVGVVGGVAAADASNRAAAEQKKANEVNAAQQKIDSLESRRQRVREERIRRARILASAENSGTSSSSGSVGAVSALGSNLAGLVSSSAGQSLTNTAANRYSQRAADLDAQAQFIGGITTAFQNGLNSFGSIFDNKD